MIPLRFGLFHSGGKMSYLRYLTFKSLRHFHPDSKIELYVTDEFKTDNYNWNREQQDFEHNSDGNNYLSKLSELGVDVIPIWEDLKIDQYAPNYQSDFFRWRYLKEGGGFYLDTDQIILKSFSELPLDNYFLYTKYSNPQCGMYTPVGVLGANEDSKIIEAMQRNIEKLYNPNNYNCIGPSLFLAVINHFEKNGFTEEVENLPSYVWYPVYNSDEVGKLIAGKFNLHPNSVACHWFGGHPFSQKFNKAYTEEFAQKSDDTMSVFLRDNNII